MLKSVQADDVYKMQQPTDCEVSPDGRSVAVTVSAPDKKTLKSFSHIWIVPTSGGEPRQFTQGKSVDRHPRFSPDGSSLAFLSSRSGRSEVWTMPTDGGEARQLTKLDGSISEFTFSPDGRKLALIFTPRDKEAKEREERKKKGEPGQDAPLVRSIERIWYKLDGAGFLPKGRAHLWIADVESGRCRQLTDDDRYDEDHPVFSPDGKWVFFNSNRADNPDLDMMKIDIWKVPTRGGEVVKIRTFEGPATNFSLSPDGSRVAFIGTPDKDGGWGKEHQKLWMAPAKGGRPVLLSEGLDRTCENTTISDTFGMAATVPPAWSPDGRWIYFGLSSEGNSELWRVDVKTRRPSPVINSPGAIIDFSPHFATRSLYATFSDSGNPGELIRFSANGKRSVRVLTKWNEWLRDRHVFIPEEFWFHGKGRHRLQGWVMSPRTRSKKKGPAILYIHGGPEAQYGHVFFHEFQVLAGLGYTVFYTNPRGGSGYSEKHLAAIYNAWGTIDYDDLMRFTDEVLDRYRQIDRRRLGVAGGSYGGYMTNWIIGQTDRFAAAVTQRSVVNLMSFAGSSDFGFAWPKVFGHKTAWEDPDQYLKQSPILYADSMRTPTLIEHQENDDRCPIEQAEQLFAALKARKVPTEFHRYPGESHGMSRGGRPDRRIERLSRIRDWFDRWLGVRRRDV